MNVQGEVLQEEDLSDSIRFSPLNDRASENDASCNFEYNNVECNGIESDDINSNDSNEVESNDHVDQVSSHDADHFVM